MIGVNDMSLPWGARFDLGPRYGGSFWAPPHSEHPIGTNTDVPFQYLGNYRETFRQIAEQNQATVEEHGGNHFHLRFPN